MGGLILESLEWGGLIWGGLILYGACNEGPGIVRNVPNPGSVSQQVMERIGEVSFPRQVRGGGRGSISDQTM